MNGYNRTRALQRTLRRRQRIRSVLCWLAVVGYVSGFMAAIILPPMAIPLLAGAFVLHLLGITE